MPGSLDIARPLRPFAPSSDGAVRALNASAEREGDGMLRFRYELHADLSALCIPATSASRRADELWKHTCFEAFIARSPRTGAYYELNFSPSTEWAAYSFEDYRRGMTPVAAATTPSVTVLRDAAQLVVDVRIATQGLLPDAWRSTETRLSIALSAVIEAGDGRITYWALSHAPDKPDFHHAAGFILEV